MRILINLLNFRPGKIGGTETYLRELVAHLPGVVRDERIILLTSRDTAVEFADSPLEIATVAWTTDQLCAWRVLEAAATGLRARSIAAAIARLRPDVVLFPQQSMFPKAAPCPSVLVVHDLFHLVCPQYLTAAQRWYRNRSYPAAMESADKIIAVSETTKRSVLQYYRCLADRISVIPHGVRKIAPSGVEPCIDLPRPYLYYPAATLPHKNHERLFRSIAGLRAAGTFPYHLLLTGVRTPHWRRLRRLRRRLRLQNIVSHLGYVSYDMVLRLIRGAECVVFPSGFEGFGIPVVEAAALDRKVITSQIDVFDELGVPPARRIDFADLDAFSRALADPSSTALLRQPWTWSECARATLDVLCAAAETSRTLPIGRANLTRADEMGRQRRSAA
jgi:glycosyltransferase involved in cell wall biosynthesis